ASEVIRREIAAAAGNEVSFVATLDAGGVVVSARAVARGTIEAVLALPGVAQRGEMLLNNHPSGHLGQSRADRWRGVWAHDEGIGCGIVDKAATRLYVVVEVPRGSERSPIGPFEVISLLGAAGPIAHALGGYENRQSQRDLTAHL